MRLYLTTLNRTDSVIDGFLPAAAALGWDVTILTDRPEDYPGHEVISTDVRDPRALIDAIAAHHPPDAVFSNSDHLQAETALAAEYFGLPHKDWRACVTAKNKALMRRRLSLAAVEPVRSIRLPPGAVPPEALPHPVVVKPALGVASEDVVLATGPAELAAAVRAIRKRRPDDVLVAEEYLDGPLHTLETLGDGHGVPRVIGGFRTTLGPLPYFVEERLDWHPDPPPEHRRHVIAALTALGVGLGACHTEYTITRDGPRIIEVNYRLIGDNCDFLLADLNGVPLHEWILRVHAGEPLPEPFPNGPDPYGTAQYGAGRSGAALGSTDQHGTSQHERSITRVGLSGAAIRSAGVRSGGLHGAVVSIVADRPGVITAAPPALALPPPSPPLSGSLPGTGVRLWHRPLRAVGDRIEPTNTNRDYLGLIRVIGPDRAGVDTAIDAFRTDHPWVIE